MMAEWMVASWAGLTVREWIRPPPEALLLPAGSRSRAEGLGVGGPSPRAWEKGGGRGGGTEGGREREREGERERERERGRSHGSIRPPYTYSPSRTEGKGRLLRAW